MDVLNLVFTQPKKLNQDTLTFDNIIGCIEFSMSCPQSSNSARPKLMYDVVPLQIICRFPQRYAWKICIGTVTMSSTSEEVLYLVRPRRSKCPSLDELVTSHQRCFFFSLITLRTNGSNVSSNLPKHNLRALKQTTNQRQWYDFPTPKWKERFQVCHKTLCDSKA